ncbi:hypothetical protein QGN31_06555 [Mycobacterium sp. 2-64]|uniref:hypothetical protein n=1 Tax=Mycobacterium sp. 2-64 TaxID=3042319 RepID=UPI002DDC860E|nr:hypothetical protein [Mycobacterium sp. 2-64]WSE52723.1 hypothetical protein QGN31_06555 [Mycobacterium sp. 2-64]
MRRTRSADNITAAELAAAFHEAGHAVAAVLLGGRVHKAVLGERPRTEYDDLPDSVSARTTYAGPWAEARWLRGRSPGPGDMQRVLPTTSLDWQALVAAGGPAAGLAVIPLLERCWPAVERVAAELLVKGQVGHDEICTALGVTDDGGPGSLELANIRAGLRAVS